MPVLYKPFQSNLEDKKSGKKLFYPHVVRTGNINSAQLSKEIAAYSSLSPGDVKNTLDNLVTVMAQHLQSSESVSVDGLGTFRMVMSARGRGVETADEVSAAQATLTVRFQPTTTKNLDRTTATRSMVTGAKLSLIHIWHAAAIPCRASSCTVRIRWGAIPCGLPESIGATILRVCRGGDTNAWSPSSQVCCR